MNRVTNGFCREVLPVVGRVKIELERVPISNLRVGVVVCGGRGRLLIRAIAVGIEPVWKLSGDWLPDSIKSILNGIFSSVKTVL